MCDQETSRMKRSWPALGRNATRKKKKGCCSCCYSLSLTCYTGHSHFIYKAGIMKVTIQFGQQLFLKIEICMQCHMFTSLQHTGCWWFCNSLAHQLLRELTVQWNSLMIFMEKCNKSPYSARKHSKSVILKIMSFCNYILKLTPPF